MAACAGVAEDACRLDVWLWRARFCKTRALAAKRVAEGEITLLRQGRTSVIDKPSRQIRPGDVLTIAVSGSSTSLRVEATGERRGPAAEARMLYSAVAEG